MCGKYLSLIILEVLAWAKFLSLEGVVWGLGVDSLNIGQRDVELHEKMNQLNRYDHIEKQEMQLKGKR